MVKKICETGGF